jgi:arabinose-5-phosphate isomerase
MNIKLVCFDFDGVFTTGDVYINGNTLNKKYNIKDGMGLSILKQNNIKTGLITGFKKNYLINENNSNDVIKHLNFDYIKIGIENKLEALENIILETNINYDEIAYIGDDINDIDILTRIGFSACSNDAIQECKNIVKYICKKKGGDGCIREFIDKVIELKSNKYNKIINEIKREANYQLNNLNINELEDIAKLIIDKNKIDKIIYCTGVGKSENIAIHFSNLLKSIGLKSFYLNCLNSIHGDIGTINKNDIIFLFSKSGNTQELINIIPSLKLHNPYIISISCNNNGILNNLSNKEIILPLNNELRGNINTIPTNSYMSMMFFINVIIMIIIDLLDIKNNNYKLNHPGGNIGNSLLTIKDCLIKEFPIIVLDKNLILSDILLEMTKYSIGCCFFINNNNKLLGLLTDGDIRRLLCKDKNLNIIRIENINTNYYYETDINKMICELENIKKYKFIPILKDDELIGIIKI